MNRACQQIDELLSLYSEGELPAPRARQVSAHLEGCGDCRQRLSDLDRAVLALQQCPPAMPPPGMLQAFHARLHEEKVSRCRRTLVFVPWQSRLVPLAAAAVLILVVGGYILRAPAPEVARLGDPGRPSRAPGQSNVVAVAPEGETSHLQTKSASGPAARQLSVKPVSKGSSSRNKRVSKLRQPQRSTARSHPASVSPKRRGNTLASNRRVPSQKQAVTVAQIESTAPQATLEIAAESVDLVDPDTGNVSRMTIARVVEPATGKLHISLKWPAAGVEEGEESNDG